MKLKLILFSLLLVSGTSAMAAPSAEAIFAGGCFWCMEPPFDKTSGVLSTTSGYTGGKKSNPTYQDVSAGKSGHIEALKVVYDPSKVSYSQLLKIFWKNIDPVDGGGQFCDRGPQYQSAIFYLNEEQRKEAASSKAEVEKKITSVKTELLAAQVFYPAEDYHQDYYQKNPLRYKYYRFSCGRDKRLEKVWGK